MSDNQHIEPTVNEQPVSLNKPAAPNQPVAIDSTHTAGYQAQQPIIIERKGGRGTATGALVLSVLALGTSGFLFVEGQNVLKQQENSVQNALKDAALGESENAQRLKVALEQQDKLNQSVIGLSRDQNQDHQNIANMQRSYNELLKGRVNWLVDEIEVTLNVASQQLLLSGNVPIAISALNTIEQRLKRFDQPELIPIKKAVSDDLNDLKAQGGNYLDVASTSLKVDGLEKSVASLPLVVDSTLQPIRNEAEPTATDADFWTRTWDKTISMLKSMVEIRKLESDDAMLLSPEQIYFVRANLRLRLLDARLALLQHNNDIYKKNLDEVKLTVSQYFDTSAPTTQEWLKTLNELSQQNLQIVSDTALSRSQTAVRNYQTQADSDKQPILLNDIPARSDIVLPSIASPAAAKIPASNEVASQSASQVAVPVVKAASVPVVAASKVASNSTNEKLVTNDQSKNTQPETTTPAKPESASGVSAATVATGAAAGLAAVPVAKALAEKVVDKKADTPSDSKNNTPSAQKSASQNESNARQKAVERNKKINDRKRENRKRVN